MQTSLLPQSVVRKLDVINRNFLWGFSTTRNKLHLINWDIVCLSKAHGGLSLPLTKARNYSLIASLSWRAFITNASSLWACFIRALPHSSHLRKLLDFGWSLCVPHCKTIIGNGHGTQFWSHNWLPVRPLRKLIHGPLSSRGGNSQGLRTSSPWPLNLERLSFILPDDILTLIHQTTLPLMDQCDATVWSLTPLVPLLLSPYIVISLVIPPHTILSLLQTPMEHLNGFGKPQF